MIYKAKPYLNCKMVTKYQYLRVDFNVYLYLKPPQSNVFAPNRFRTKTDFYHYKTMPSLSQICNLVAVAIQAHSIES